MFEPSPTLPAARPSEGIASTGRVERTMVRSTHGMPCVQRPRRASSPPGYHGASVTSAPIAIHAPPGASATASPSTTWHSAVKRFVYE